MDHESIKKLYGKSVRLRVCGLYVENNSILLIKHKGLGKNGMAWLPPGGGVEVGISLEENLKREFMEETGLKVKVEEFLFLYEYKDQGLHAIELFFKVTKLEGKIITGFDPEYSKENQIIEKTELMPFNTIDLMNKNSIHGIFSLCKNASEALNLRGFYKF